MMDGAAGAIQLIYGRRDVGEPDFLHFSNLFSCFLAYRLLSPVESLVKLAFIRHYQRCGSNDAARSSAARIEGFVYVWIQGL